MKIDLEKIKNLPPDVKKDFMKMYIKYGDKKKESLIKNDFMSFVKHCWPDFIEGEHHKTIAEKFNKISTGELKRVIINMPPRHTKSEFSSFLLPAWMIGRNPKLKIIQSTHTTELAVRFGRKAKTLMDTEEYKQVFDTRLRQDSQAAGKWETEQGGEYFAAGVGGAITGRGADLLIIDDPHSEQDAMNADSLERAYEWYTSGPRQRLQPGGTIVLVMTRWSTKDLTGKLLKASSEPRADQWDVIEFPAIMPSGEPVWPEFWNRDELLGVKASLAVGKWNAQWMQNPTSEEGSLLKREWWQNWEEDDIPNAGYERCVEPLDVPGPRVGVQHLVGDGGDGQQQHGAHGDAGVGHVEGREVPVPDGEVDVDEVAHRPESPPLHEPAQTRVGLEVEVVDDLLTHAPQGSLVLRPIPSNPFRAVCLFQPHQRPSRPLAIRLALVLVVEVVWDGIAGRLLDLPRLEKDSHRLIR